MLRKREPWDTAIAQKAEAYLRENFGVSAWLEPASTDDLPFFVGDQYRLWSAPFFQRRSIFMALRPDADPSVEEMARHVDVVRKALAEPLVVLLFEGLSPGRRKALLGRRMAFLVPNAQLYIPEILLDLRERTAQPKPREPEQFSPTAQVAILGAILPGHGEDEDASATALARRYGVAIMSMTRAFDELAAANLAETNRTGRQRTLRFHTRGRELWDLAAPKLKTPVRKVRTVVIPYPDRFPGLVAGESALGLYTALNRPRMQRLAVASADWNQLVRDHGLRDSFPRDSAGDEVETWAYDPSALAQNNVVDPLSLHLSLRDDPDDRIALAAAALVEDFAWS